MPRKLFSRAADFPHDFARLLGEKREASQDVNDVVSAIIARVRAEGDAAVLELTNQFDRQSLSLADLRISESMQNEAAARITEEDKQALQLAADRIRAFHARQKPEDLDFSDEAGVRLGHRWQAVEAAGLYVPGGLATYYSSVLMNAIPAKVAGVERLVMCVPTPDGVINDMVLYAAQLCGVDEIYRVGGAQAIAAMAFGTDSIQPVDVIVGPGNAYVAAAKRQVFGQVGIDMIAGPSEILVIADNQNDPSWVAIDLLSQAEHGGGAQALLITDDEAYCDQVFTAVEAHLDVLPRSDLTRADWEAYGAAIVVGDLSGEAPALVDRIAPEHLEICTDNPREMMQQIRNAGAIFLGRHTPEAIGDYVAGTNHVLPTARSARFASGLSVLDFMKRSSIVECTAASLAVIGPAAVRLAEGEGLPAHAKSVAVRLE